MQRRCISIFPKKTRRRPTGTWEDAQHHSPIGRQSQNRKRWHTGQNSRYPKSRNEKRWKACAEKKSLVHRWWECKWVQPLWKRVWRFFKKLRIQLPFDAALLLLSIYLKNTETLIQKKHVRPHIYCNIVCNSQNMAGCPYAHMHTHTHTHGLPRWLSDKESTCQPRRQGLDPWVRKIPWRRAWQPIPVFLHGKFQGQKSLAGYSP